MVGGSLVIKQGQPESHEINDEVIVNSPTALYLAVNFLFLPLWQKQPRPRCVGDGLNKQSHFVKTTWDKKGETK